MPRRPGVDQPRVSRREERALIDEQRQITAAQLRAKNLLARRDARAARMFHDLHYSQRLLAELLTVGATNAGGDPLTEDAVQKALSRRIA